jgi:aminomethyltransferase
MIPSAGYDMPVYYPEGIVKEHIHCRTHAGIFDVSNMGFVKISGSDATAFLERHTVADVKALPKGKAALSLLMKENGGIYDDCILIKDEEDKFLVVFNAGCKDKDLAHLNK